MNYYVGMKVTRKSYDNDIVFIITEIKNKLAYLKGVDVRLYADAPLDDLELTDRNDDYEPEFDLTISDRDEYFYLPGKILHIDGDKEYLNKCMNFYKKCGIKAVGKQILESHMPNEISYLIKEIKPDILVITGHDAFNKGHDLNNIDSYKNSKYFVSSVIEARNIEKSHDKLVIIAGACQSAYEELIKAGANFASSPKRINIHALDPSIIAVNLALTDTNSNIDIKEILKKTKYGKDGIGGLVGKGMMYVGYPRCN